MKIFIDPGHGGNDPGAVAASALEEANVNLDVAKRLGAILAGRGFDIEYSRSTNVFVGLNERAQMANKWGANYFVSIHCNASELPAANGTETLYYKPGSTSEDLAATVQEALVSVIELNNRGIKQQNVAVLRLTKMPAILVELAFITNPEEGELLRQPEFRQKCAEGIAMGLIEFIEV